MKRTTLLAGGGAALVAATMLLAGPVALADDGTEPAPVGSTAPAQPGTVSDMPPPVHDDSPVAPGYGQAQQVPGEGALAAPYGAPAPYAGSGHHAGPEHHVAGGHHDGPKHEAKGHGPKGHEGKGHGPKGPKSHEGHGPEGHGPAHLSAPTGSGVVPLTPGAVAPGAGIAPNAVAPPVQGQQQAPVAPSTDGVAPDSGASGHGAPAPDAPVYGAPEKDAPAYRAPTQGAPTYGAPGHETQTELPTTVESTVESYRTGPDGQVDGLVLADGSIVKLPKDSGTPASNFPVGSELRIDGVERVSPEGETHLRPTTITDVASGESIEIAQPVR